MKVLKSAVLTLAAIIFLCSAAYATGTWLKSFTDLYKPKPKSALGKAGCSICHTSEKFKLNCYGKMLESKKMDTSTFKSIEKKDSDGDGFSNLREIRLGTLPGDAGSKPKK